MSQHRDFSALTVAITGGARGIGAATARLLRDAGARVVISDRDETLLGRTADELGVLAHPLDVTDPAQWEAFAETVGPVDVLINNAGIMPTGPFTSESAALTRQIFEINTFGPINGARTFAPRMIAQGRGHIINIASAVGRVALAGGATYSASKHAVVGFTEALREELEPFAVDVSMVLPVIVKTQLAAGVADTRGVPMVTPEQVAAVIVDTISRPVAEAWVPRWGQPMARASMVLPRRVQEFARRVTKADGALSGSDAGVRAAYEADVRGR